MLKRCVIIALFIFSAAGNALAYRPFSTEDAGVAGKGVIQTEISWDYMEWENDDTDRVLLFVPIFGLTERFEFSLELPYMFHDPEDGESKDGIGDINIVGKYLLVEEGEKSPAFTLKAVLKTDSGDEDKGLGSGDEDYCLVAAASKTIGDITLHGQFGYTWIGDDEDENLRDITVYGFAIDYSLTEDLHLLAEINGNRHPDRNEDDDPLGALAGITYNLSDKLILDAGLRWGFNDAYPDWGVTMGVSITY